MASAQCRTGIGGYKYGHGVGRGLIGGHLGTGRGHGWQYPIDKVVRAAY